MRDVYGFNEGEMCFILSWFRVHLSILRSWGDISVLLVLWQSCWGVSRVQSSKSRILMRLIWKTQLLCMQCRGIGPHLVARGKSHGFSRVAACKIFSCSMWTLRCGMWDLVPWPGIETGPPALGVQSPSHWTTREVPRNQIFNLISEGFYLSPRGEVIGLMLLRAALSGDL